MKQYEEGVLSGAHLDAYQSSKDMEKQRTTRIILTDTRVTFLQEEYESVEKTAKPYPRVVLTDGHLATLRNEGLSSVPTIARYLVDQAAYHTKEADEARVLVAFALEDPRIDPEIRPALFKAVMEQITQLDAQSPNLQESKRLWPHLLIIEETLLSIQQTLRVMVKEQKHDTPEARRMLHEANMDRLSTVRRYLSQMCWLFLCVVMMAAVLGFFLAFLFPQAVVTADILFLGGILANVIGGFAGVQHVRAATRARLELNEGPYAPIFDDSLEQVLTRSRKTMWLLVVSIPISAAMVFMSMWLVSGGTTLDRNFVLAWCTAILTAIMAFTAGSMNYGARMGSLVTNLLHPIRHTHRLPLSERI